MYRISFLNNTQIFEIYAKNVYESPMFGFIQVSDFVWSTRHALIVDTHEEKLKAEFSDVTSTLIPMQSIIRIDEVNEAGIAKIKDRGLETSRNSNITPFPASPNSVI
jgi:hypothetical protein